MSPTLQSTARRGSRVRSGRSNVKLSIAVELPRERASVPTVRHLVAHSLSELGVVEEIVHDVEIAVSEVCTNVIDHAEFGESYEVRVSVKGDDCEIRVIDRGRGIHGTARVASGPTIELERGRGLMIVRAVMDRVGLESRPDHGTLVTLGKRLEFGRVLKNR